MAWSSANVPLSDGEIAQEIKKIMNHDFESDYSNDERFQCLGSEVEDGSEVEVEGNESDHVGTTTDEDNTPKERQPYCIPAKK